MEPIGECIPITDGLHCCPTCDFQTVLLPNLQTHINSVHGETSDFEWKLPAAEIHRQMLSYKNDRFVDLAKRKPTERQAKPKKKIRTVFRCQLVAPPPPPVILAVQSLQIDQNETSAEPSESAITATIDNVLSTLRDSIESDSSEPLRALSGVELPDVELMTVSDEFRKNFESILEAKNLRPLESLPNVWASVPQPYTDAVAAVFENRMSSYAAADTFKLKRNSLRKYLNDTFNQLKRLGIASVYSSSDNRYFFYECQDLVAEMDILSSSVQTSLASPRSQMPRVGSSPSYDGSTSIEERILRGIEDLKITCSDEDYHKRLAVAVTSVINKTKSVGLAAGEYLVEPSDVVEVVVFLCKNYSDVTHWSSHVYSHLSYEEFRHLVYSYPFKVNIPEEEMESIAEGLYAASASGANLRFICARYRLLYPRLYHMVST